MRIEVSSAQKLWIPHDGLRWPPPRAVQLVRMAVCALRGHDWGSWRIETEDWFEYVDGPQPYAWRGCRRGCGRLERCIADQVAFMECRNDDCKGEGPFYNNSGNYEWFVYEGDPDDSYDCPLCGVLGAVYPY